MKNAEKYSVVHSLVLILAVLFFSLFTPVLLAETRLVVLHSNDHHGHIQASGTLGGLARFATLVKQIRSEYLAEKNEFVILIDAGDVNLGTPESDIFNAKPDFEVYNYLVYDFVAFGNHEFDPPFSKLQTQIKEAKFPFGSANVLGVNGQPLGTAYRIMDFPECRVGIFGLTIHNPNIFAKSGRNYTILDETETARQMVHFLREEQHVDFVIAVTHIGLLKEVGNSICSSDLPNLVSGIDLIIDGHSHSLMQEPLIVNGVPIVSANEWSKYLGKACFSFEAGKVQSFTWQCIPVTESIPEDLETVKILTPYIEAAQKKLGETIAKTTDEFPGNEKICRREETALGDLAADCMVWAAHQDEIPCDFALVNGGNIRASLPKGDVHRSDVASAFPFQNEIWILEMDGNTLKQLFDFIATIQPAQAAFPQFSREIKCEVDLRNQTIQNVKIHGESILPEKHYFVAVTDFIARGGDGYTVMKNHLGFRVVTRILPQAVSEYIQTLPQPLVPQNENRFILVK